MKIKYVVLTVIAIVLFSTNVVANSLERDDRPTVSIHKSQPKVEVLERGRLLCPDKSGKHDKWFYKICFGGHQWIFVSEPDGIDLEQVIGKDGFPIECK